METQFSIEPRMNKMSAPKYLNDMILNGLKRGWADFLVDIQNSTQTYPNICVPFAGIIDYYKSKKGINFDFKLPSDKWNYVAHTSCVDPSVVEDEGEIKNPLGKVWRYGTPEGINGLVSSFIQEIRQSDEIEKGVLNSIEWCINEAMDNVLQHSQAPYGFIMGQMHKEQKKLSLTIYDWGIGIYNTLKNSKHSPATPLDAITVALQERVTRDESVGQGNGMWGLFQIISENRGIIRIRSNGASYEYENGKITVVKAGVLNLGEKYGSTTIDFQLDYSKPIDITKALNGHTVLDTWLESRELDGGGYLINVAKDANGTGTRQSAKKLRNAVLNIYQETQQRIILDFANVNVVSSSFADELLGKIVAERGIMFFMGTIKLVNLSNFNMAIINRSMEQRIAQNFMGSGDKGR